MKGEKESGQEELELRQSGRCCSCIYLSLSDFDCFTCQRAILRTYPLEKKGTDRALSSFLLVLKGPFVMFYGVLSGFVLSHPLVIVRRNGCRSLAARRYV